MVDLEKGHSLKHFGSPSLPQSQMRDSAQIGPQSSPLLTESTMPRSFSPSHHGFQRRARHRRSQRAVWFACTPALGFRLVKVQRGPLTTPRGAKRLGWRVHQQKKLLKGQIILTRRDCDGFPTFGVQIDQLVFLGLIDPLVSPSDPKELGETGVLGSCFGTQFQHVLGQARYTPATWCREPLTAPDYPSTDCAII